MIMEQMGVVKGVSFGMRDGGSPALWFVVETLGGGSLQSFNLEEAGRLIEEAQCYDIKQLEGRACVVDSNGAGSLMKFIRWHKT